MEFVREGEVVEVSGEAEGGFKDKWYAAKIIKISNGTNVLVEYSQFKASEQGLKRYQSNVNLCYVRPLPPKQPTTQLAFQLYQIVDAFHNDGWRKGRIVSAFDGLSFKMFTVHFQHPDEKIDFGADKLRIHLDWVGGNYQMKMHYCKGGSSSTYFGNQNKQKEPMVITPSSATPSPQTILHALQPLKPPQSEAEKKKNNKNGESMEDNQTSEQQFFEEGNSAPSSSALKRKAAEPSFTNGTQVEVSLPDKHCCGAWFPATVIKKTKSESFFVQYNSLRLSVAAGILRDIVHAKHIRPSPPENFRGIPFYVADKVDTFFDFGWWSGVITEVLPSNKYTVQFQHQSNRRAFNQNELRCHIEWINEEMVQQSRDIGIDKAQLCNVDITDESLTRKRKIDHTIPSSDAEYPPPNKKLHQGEASQVTVGMSLSDGSADLPKLKLCQEKTRSAFDGDRSGNQEKVVDSTFSFPLTIKGEPCDWSRSIYQVNYPQNSLAAQSSAHSTEPLGAHDINQNNGGVAGYQSIENVSEGVSTDNQHTSQLCMAITSTEAPTMGNEAQEAMCLKEDKNTGDQCHNALENGDNEIVMAPFLNDHNSNLNVLENESLPFIKSSPGWKDVESNEIFRSMPQKPHFRPLQKKPELLREGKALGLMVSFASLVEKISKTHYDEPKSILEGNLKLLSYFKSFGFNVQPIQDRQEELLRVKEEEVQIDRKLKQVEGKIVKGEIEEEGLRLDIDKFDKVLGEYNEKIMKLQEYVNKMSMERQIVVEIKQTEGSILASLRDSRNKIEKERQSTKQKFNRIASASW